MSARSDHLTPAEQERRRAAAMHATRATPQDPLGDGSHRGPDGAGDEQPAPQLPENVYVEFDPIDTWVATRDGLRRWRPVIDRFTVTPLPNGARLLETGIGRLRIDADEARHLAQLLSPEGR